MNLEEKSTVARKKPSSKKSTKRRIVRASPAKPSSAKAPREGEAAKILRRAKHRVSHALARRMRKAYIAKYADRQGALDSGTYSRRIFEQILKQPACVGLRFYAGLDRQGRVSVLFCGVDANGDDILAGIIGDVPVRCPPICGGANGILQF